MAFVVGLEILAIKGSTHVVSREARESRGCYYFWICFCWLFFIMERIPSSPVPPQRGYVDHLFWLVTGLVIYHWIYILHLDIRHIKQDLIYYPATLTCYRKHCYMTGCPHLAKPRLFVFLNFAPTASTHCKVQIAKPPRSQRLPMDSSRHGTIPFFWPHGGIGTGCFPR